jgi:hypothetical protein
LKLNVTCKSCATENEFAQPYAYHAGFGNQGFLYDEAGTLTLIWSTFDPSWQQLVGKTHPWGLTAQQRDLLETALLPAPSGGKWLFGNPPRCLSCGASIGDSIISTIYFFVYPNSVDLESLPSGWNFSLVLR